MKKNIKKLSALACAILFTLPTTAVFAEYNPENTNTTAAIATKAVPITPSSITVDDELIDNAKSISYENSVFIPIRAVAQALGFQVLWDNESKTVSLANMPVFITFQIGVDGYTFAKTAPMPLGAAPKLIDNTTYVPIEVVSELMGLKTEKKGDTINIVSYKAETEENEQEFENNENIFGKGEIISIDEENNQIVINDTAMGEVVLNIENNNIIKDNNGSIIEFSSLKEGDKLSVEYSPAMTMSLPPINNPVEIIIGEF